MVLSDQRRVLLLCVLVGVLFVYLVTFSIVFSRRKSSRHKKRVQLAYDPNYFERVGACTIRYVNEEPIPYPICMCEVHIGSKHKEQYRRMTENKLAYAKQRGLDYLMLETSPYPGVNPANHKICFLRYLMETTSYEWFALVDSDTVVTDFSIAFDEYVHDDTDLVLSLRRTDPKRVADDDYYVQGSAFLVRNCPLMKSFLDDVWYSICTAVLPFNFDPSRNDWGEQSHVQLVSQKLKYATRCTYAYENELQCAHSSKVCATMCVDGHRPFLSHPIKEEESLDIVLNGSCDDKKNS